MLAYGHEKIPPGPGDMVGRKSGLAPPEPGGLVEAEADDDARVPSPTLSFALCSDASAARCLCREQAGSACGQLALRRRLSASQHASGCPKARPASANPPLGRRCPATRALFFTRRGAVPRHRAG